VTDELAVLRGAVLRTFPNWDPTEVAVAPLGGGITNRNAVVSVASPVPKRFVVRLPGERTEVLGIDRAHEAEAARRAASLGIAPGVVAELDGIGTLVTEFVPGVHLAAEEFARRLDDVVPLLLRFHGSGPLAGAFPIHRVVEWHARDATRHGVHPPAAASTLHALSRRIEHAFAASPEPVVPCHNDLLPGNVVFDERRTWLLDFEYAGMNERCFDLANLSVNCGFDADSDERLLAAYFGDVTSRHRSRLALMKVMSEYREGMWAVVQQAISTLDTDFVAYAAERLDRALGIAAGLDLDRELTAAAQPFG
jgi:thiamine kinase-like enzyme